MLCFICYLLFIRLATYQLAFNCITNHLPTPANTHYKCAFPESPYELEIHILMTFETLVPLSWIN